MKKILLGVGIIVLVILWISVWFFSEDAYFKIRNSEPERGRFYLAIYSATMSSSKFDALLKRLIEENMDLKSIGTAVTYIENHKLCSFIPIIEKKCFFLNSIPPDSSWKVKLKNNYTRVWKAKEPLINYSMCYRLEEIKKNCTK